jgi:LmbE family N-acetylglucosaminyl deacetylase
MSNLQIARSPLLNDLTALPIRSGASVRDFGPTLVVAPHPDDESLGCGGAIALLAQFRVEVRVLFVSDGAGSHPASRRFPPASLSAIREAEARAALTELGIPPDSAAFLRLPDRSVPRIGSAGFAHAVSACREHLWQNGFSPQTVMLPWRRDPHTDHRAVWEIMTAALSVSPAQPRIIEYPIWIWDLGLPEDMPEPGEAAAWRLDIGNVLERKLRAIAAHRSQTTAMIDDDPDGWHLSPRFLERFSKSWEVFLEPLE